MLRRLGEAPNIGPEHSSLPRWARPQAADGLAAAIAGEARLRGFALFVDDVQWADAATIELLHRLVEQRPPSLALVVALRPAPAARRIRTFLAELDQRDVVRIDLGPLADDEVEALATSLRGERLEPELLALVRSSGGNPLLITDVVEAVGDNGLDLQRDATYGRPAVPAPLRATVIRRLTYLPEHTLAVMRLASVFGGPFDLVHLALVLGRRAADTARVLSPAVAAGLVVERGDQLDFAHDLIRAALYDAIPRAERRALHREVGSLLAGIGADPHLVATHLALGATSGDELAVEWLRRAAQRALGTAPLVSADLLRHAASIARPDQEIRSVVIAELVTALVTSGDVNEAQTTARRALQSIPVDNGAWRIHGALGEVYFWNEQNLDAARELQLALARADGGTRGRLLALLAGAMIPEGDFARGRAAASAALEVAGESDAYTRWLANESLAYERFATGHLADATAPALRALEIGKAAGPPLVWFATPAAARYLIHADDLEAAEVVLDTEPVVADGTAWPIVLHARAAAALAFAAGRWTEFDAHAARAESDIGIPVAMDRIPLVAEAARIAIARGDLERARRWLAVFATDPAADRFPDFRAWIEALIADREGAAERAGDLVARGVEATERRRYPIRYRQLAADLVRIAANANRPHIGALVTAAMQELAARAAVTSVSALALHCRALVDGDLGTIRDCVAGYRTTPRRYELARALESQGQVALAAGEHAEARVAFGEAAELFAATGAALDAAAARRGVRAAGGRTPARRRGRRPRLGWEALTPTEVQVSRLLAAGDRNADIARRLFISKRTVETHLWRIYSKLGASSRVDIARAVMTHDAYGSSPVPGRPTR